MAVHLHHVPWEHSQIFSREELKDVKIARQVTSSLFCQSRDEMPDARNRRSCFYVSLCLNSVESQIELKDLGALLKGKLHYPIVLSAKLETQLEETLDFILRKRLQHSRVQ